MVDILRFGLHYRVDTENGVIPEGYAIFDLPGFFIQNGIKYVQLKVALDKVSR